MLCRVADSLFWMGRYLERAENLARLTEAHLELTLEVNPKLPGQDAQPVWEPILQSLGDRALFDRIYGGEAPTNQRVIDFLTFARDNPSSIISCVDSARENARMIRDQISKEMWEVLNRLYLFLREQRATTRFLDGSPHEFFEQITEHTLLFQGLVESIFPHRSGYEFIKAGRFLERADKTARILDVKYHMLLPHVRDVGGVVDTAGWATVLRASSALEAYHHTYVTDITPSHVADLLILSREFPRSIAHSVLRLQAALHAISGCPLTHYGNEAERLVGKLIADLTYTPIATILDQGLHDYLCHVSDVLSDIAQAFSQQYMFFAIVDPAGEAATSDTGEATDGGAASGQTQTQTQR